MRLAKVLGMQCGQAKDVQSTGTKAKQQKRNQSLAAMTTNP